MAIPFLSNIDLSKNEIQNAVWHKLNAVPSNPKEGQYYYNTNSKRLKYYNGTAWITVGEYADKLTTARTITFDGDTTGSFTFDGSTDKSVDIQVKDDSHYHSAASITDSAGYNSASSIAPLYQAKINESRACRTAFTPANAVKIEYSTDGGATWTDYGASDSQKRELFAMNRGVSIYIGGNATINENVTTNMQTRVTISPTDRYAGVNQAYIYLSTMGHSCKVDIERSTIGNKEKFTKIRDNVTVSGWDGPNIVNFISGTYGGGSSQTSNYYSYRFTFKISAVGSTQAYIKNKPYIKDIRMYGSNIWDTPNRMSFTDHIYGWDATQSVWFPNAVRAKDFIITGTNNSNYTRFWSSDAANNMYASINGKIPLVITDGEVKSGKSYAGTINLGSNTVKWNNVYANTYHGALNGNASTATKLATARNLKIGNTAKAFDGSADVTWTWEQMGVPRVKTLTNTDADYTDFVIPLCSLDNSNAYADLYFCGTIYLKRSNILKQMTKIDCMCGKYYNSTDPRYIIEVSGFTSPISAVTFNHNSKKYFGIMATLPSSAYDGFSRVVGLAQDWSFINAIQIYNSNSKTVYNKEIRDSLATMPTTSGMPHQFYGDVYADSFRGISTKTQSLFYGVTAGNATTQTATISGIKEYYSGLTVVLRMGYQTNASSTININGLGAVPIYYGNTTRGGYYQAGYTYTFVYDTSKATPGFVGICSYNSDSTGRYLGPTGNIKALNAISVGNIICGTKNGYSNLKSGAGFDISYPIMYAASSIAAGSTGTNNWTQYSFQIKNTQALTMVSYQAVYIKGKLDGSIFTPASTAPLTQSIPTTEDGYDYIYLGYAYAAANLQLMPEHPIFRFSNGKFRPRAEAVSGSAPIETVTSLPAITAETRNKLYRYNGHIYYVDSVSSWRNIKVGDNLSGAKIRADYPKEDEDVSGVLGGFWLDANTTAQTNINYIVTNTGQNIVYWRGGPNETHDYLDANTRLYEMSGGTCFTNLLTNEYTLPTNFGKVTSITSTTSNLYKLLYIEDSGVEKWVRLENEVEVAVQNTTPENGEVLWIEDEDIEPVSIEFIADDTGWQTLTLTSDFHTYEDSSPNIPMYRKVGKVVEIVGAIAPTSEIPSDTNKIIATLPEGYRPSKNRYFICQGSGRNIWTLYVYPNGSIVFARYGSSAYVAASTSVWLPFNVTFLVN